jgi:hypothetical protein
MAESLAPPAAARSAAPRAAHRTDPAPPGDPSKDERAGSLLPARLSRGAPLARASGQPDAFALNASSPGVIFV